MAENPHPARLVVCYLCNLLKFPWTVVFEYSEPVCRGCVYDEGSSQIEFEIHRTKEIRNRVRARQERNKLIPSTSRSVVQQMLPFSRSFSLPLPRRRNPRVMNSPQESNMLNRATVAKSVVPYDTGRTAVEPGPLGSYSPETMENKRSTASHTITTAMVSQAPDDLGFQNLSISSPNLQQRGNQNKIQFFFCFNCKRQESIYYNVQCPFVAVHTYCFRCVKNYISANLIFGTGIYCPSGHRCKSSETGMSWIFSPESIQLILSYNPEQKQCRN